MLTPLKLKYKKYNKGRAFNKIGMVKSAFNYGQLSLRSLSHAKLETKEISALYNFLRKKMKKKGRVILRLFPNLPVTKKPAEIRMGKGKGNVHKWVAKCYPGSILCEIATPNTVLALKVLKSARFKLSIKTKIFQRSL